jgi:hypothetical protein
MTSLLLAPPIPYIIEKPYHKILVRNTTALSLVGLMINTKNIYALLIRLSIGPAYK